MEIKKIILTDSKVMKLDTYENYLKFTGKKPHFFISRRGLVKQFLDVYKKSNYYSESEILNESILIVLENPGPVYRKKGYYVTVFNDELVKSSIKEYTWKGMKYWQIYTESQYKSLIKLKNELVCKFQTIENRHYGSPSHFASVKKYSGIICESNIFTTSYSVNPFFEWNKLD